MPKNVRFHKSLLFITGIFPPDIGGPATYCFRMAEEAVRRGYRVRVIAYGAADRSHTSYPFSIIRVPRYPFPVRLAVFFSSLIFYGFRYRTWYAHGGLSATLPALIAGRLLDKRVGVKVTGDYAWEQARNRGWVTDDIDTFQNKKYPARIRGVAYLRAYVPRHSDFVIVPSAYLARMVRGWGVYEKRICTVYNAVRVPAVAASGARTHARAEYRLSGFVLITVARLVPWKGVAGLVSLIPKLLARSPEYRLLVVGEGPERESLRRFAEELRVSHAVRFFGGMPHAETERLVAASDLFVLNSDYEGFSHVLLEAMGVGCPVAARACGGNKELVVSGENGYLLSATPEDGEWIRVLERARTNPAERALLAENARRSFSRFTFDRMAEATFAFL